MSAPETHLTRICHECGDTPQVWRYTGTHPMILPGQSAEVMSQIYVCEGCEPPQGEERFYVSNIHHWENGDAEC